MAGDIKDLLPSIVLAEFKAVRRLRPADSSVGLKNAKKVDCFTEAEQAEVWFEKQEAKAVTSPQACVIELTENVVF